MHNQEKRTVSASWKRCDELSNDNLKHKLHATHNLLGEGIIPLPVVYYVPFHKDYIQMSFSPETPKWESQN
jgi:hypothetical protein